jgi:heme/copper-type cytochrome/quinol oxidase subunit 3
MEATSASPRSEHPPLDRAVVGVSAFIVSESAFFVVLILSYVYFNSSPREAQQILDVRNSGAFTVCLLTSSLTLVLAERSRAKGRVRPFRAWLVATIGLGATFLIGQASEYHRLFSGGLAVDSSLFASTFFTLTGFHGLHVALGLLALAILAGLAFVGDLQTSSKGLRAVGLYWHFVDAVWVVVFSIVYLRGAA